MFISNKIKGCVQAFEHKNGQRRFLWSTSNLIVNRYQQISSHLIAPSQDLVIEQLYSNFWRTFGQPSYWQKIAQRFDDFEIIRIEDFSIYLKPDGTPADALQGKILNASKTPVQTSVSAPVVTGEGWYLFDFGYDHPGGDFYIEIQRTSPSDSNGIQAAFELPGAIYPNGGAEWYDGTWNVKDEEDFKFKLGFNPNLNSDDWKIYEMRFGSGTIDPEYTDTDLETETHSHLIDSFAYVDWPEAPDPPQSPSYETAVRFTVLLDQSSDNGTYTEAGLFTDDPPDTMFARATFGSTTKDNSNTVEFKWLVIL